MRSANKRKFSGPCAQDAQRFLGINFEQLQQTNRLTPSSIGIEIDPAFFWNNHYPDTDTPKKLEGTDKCLEKEHEGIGRAVKPNKADIEEKKNTVILQEEGSVKITKKRKMD